ncbi:hypothetical protein [Oscillibacter sp.]|uniref:hypothetical protein n=1 Tax=Oscillibacter sp. TaxID=1945593 RepID=UPI0028B0F3B9|nr:hypothetical protein [Oscillibacter sp.]
MFDRVEISHIDIYDGKTNEYYGKSIFHDNTDVEKGLLQIVNYKGKPKAMLFQNVTFLPTSNNYVPPEVFEKTRRNAIVHSALRDANSRLWVPADIHMNFDSQVRGKLLGDKYNFSSVEYTDIIVEDVKLFSQGRSDTAQK